MENPKKIETSKSVDNSIVVLRQLCKYPFRYRISELTNETGINRTALYRILNSLVTSNIVTKTEKEKLYKLGPLAYEMGSVYLSSFHFKDSIYPILDKISHETKESVGLAILENEHVISLYEIEIDQPFKMNYRPGIIYPANRGCYGKCLMAYYDPKKAEKIVRSQTYEKICENTIVDHDDILKEYEEIREQGYVVSDNETFPLAVGVGIPLFNKDGSVTTCIAVSFLRHEGYQSDIARLKKILFKYRDELNQFMI